MQDPGSVRVNQDHGSLASRVGSRVTSLPGRVGSRVSVADPVPSLVHILLFRPKLLRPACSVSK